MINTLIAGSAILFLLLLITLILGVVGIMLAALGTAVARLKN